MLQSMWNVMMKQKEDKKSGRLMKKQEQQLLDFEIVTGSWEFTQTAILDAVVKLIVTNNQVSV